MLSALAPHWRYAWLIVASLLAGLINAMAGGGSFLSFPALLGVGVAPVEANATNTVALWPGQLTSLAALRGDVRRDLLWPVAGASVVGGVLGAEALLHTKQATFLRLVPWLLLLASLLFAASGRLSRWMRGRAEHTHAEPRIPPVALIAALMPVCFYVGYFGAGGGLLVMTVLALFGVEAMHTLNAMKVLAMLIANGVAAVTFIAGGAVEWRYCLLTMVFAGAGGYVGAKLSRRMSAQVLRGFVVCVGVGIAAYFFWRQARGA